MDYRSRTLPDHRAAYLYRHNSRLGRDWRTYCPTCQKTGTYLWAGTEHDCDCRTQLNLHKLYLDAGIGLEFQVLTWEDWVGDPKVRELCGSYLDRKLYRRGKGIKLRSPNYGTGKTMAVNLLAKDLVKANVSTFVVTFSTMVAMYTGGWRDDEEREVFVEKVLDSEVLVIDDLGRTTRTSEAARNFLESTLDDVLRPRVQHGKVTVVTTNHDDLELRDIFGSAIASLLGGHTLDYTVAGGDYRPTQKKRTFEEDLAGVTRPIT